jgi:dipeptidyl aminopeptidase/acylaminoacyl peptidase
VLHGHAGGVAALAIAPDGSTAYSAGLDGTVIAWDLAGSRRLGRLFDAAHQGRQHARFAESRSIVGAISWNASATRSGDLLAVTTNDGLANVIDGRTLTIAHSLRTSRDSGGVPTFSADGRTLAVSAGNELQLWDPRTGRLLRRARASSDGLWGPRLSADGRWLAVTGLDHLVHLWDVQRFKEVKTYEEDLLPRDLSLRPDGKVLAVPVEFGTGTGRVDILARPSLKRIAQIPMPSSRWTSFSRDGRLLVVGDDYGRARLFDAHSFRPVGRPLLGHSGSVVMADFSPDGRTVATGSSDGTVRLWDTATGRPIARPLPGLPNDDVGVAFLGPTAWRRSTTPARRTCGTCARRPGSGAPARSPAAGSRARNGTTCCPATRMRRPALRAGGLPGSSSPTGAGARTRRWPRSRRRRRRGGP